MGDFLDLENVFEWQGGNSEPQENSEEAHVHLWQLASLLGHNGWLNAGGAWGQHGAVHLKFLINIFT